MVTGILIGIYFAVGSISWGELKDSLRRIGWEGFFLSFLLLSGQIVSMIFRYWALIPPGHKISRVQVGYAISVGQMVNSIFPARAGDLVKAALLSRKSSAPIAQRFTLLKALGLIVADRVVDVATLLALVLLTGALFVPEKILSEQSIPSKYTVLLILGVLVAILILARKQVGQHVSKLRKKVSSWLREFGAGLTGLRSPKQVLMAVFFAVLSWTCEFESLRILSSIQGYEMTLGQSIFVLLALNFFISVPLSFANFGPFEAGVVLALQAVMTIPKETALSVATVHHLAQIASVGFIALVCFAWAYLKKVH